MSRYSIALKKRVEKEKLSSEPLQFGIEHDLNKRFEQTKDKLRTFYLLPNEIAQVGIIFQVPNLMFQGFKVHYYGPHKFFCKSTPNQKAVCCTHNYSAKNPSFRIATILARYSRDELFSIIPWTFGKIMFNRLKDLNTECPLDIHDFRISSSENRTLYNLSALGPSIWQQSDTKERIIANANAIKANIKAYIAEDLDIGAIENIVQENHTSSRWDQQQSVSPTNRRPRPRALEDDENNIDRSRLLNNGIVDESPPPRNDQISTDFNNFLHDLL